MIYKILREFQTHKAMENYVCEHCSKTILKGISYAKEAITSRYTTAKKFHIQCFEELLNKEITMLKL
jgi:hypothetical protein|tara:strand:+ start:5779 stop:5979 length:201 start_codon:yes stop_codon:yes gene_type:complete